MENEEIYRKQVIKTFFKNGVLLKIPIQNRKKNVVLQKISSRLAVDKVYSEIELNEILKRIYPDYENIKKLLLASRFIKIVDGYFVLISSR